MTSFTIKSMLYIRIFIIDTGYKRKPEVCRTQDGL